MFKWIKSLFCHRDELVEETRVIEAPTGTFIDKVKSDHIKVELTEIQYDDMIAHRLQELIEASKLPAYKYVSHFIKGHLQAETEYEYPVNWYDSPTFSDDLKKIARRWRNNKYANKCQDESINNLMLDLSL